METTQVWSGQGPTVFPVVVRVDRRMPPLYPGWVNERLDPQLERTGPTEYRLDSIQFRSGPVGCDTGWQIHGRLLRDGTLEKCLCYRDLEEIAALGLPTFRHAFGGKRIIPAWKSGVRDQDGVAYVPCLLELGGMRLVKHWHQLSAGWGYKDLVAYFR